MKMSKHSRILKPSASRNRRFRGTKICIVLGFITIMIVCLGLTTAIRNGVLVESDEFNAVGSVGDYKGVPNCTGTLIEGNLVLTAGHCIFCDEICSDEVGTPLFKGEKCFKQKENFTLYNVTPNNKSNSRGDYTFSGEVVPNPIYGFKSANDLALIKLDKNVSEILQVKPISVAQPYKLPHDANFQLVGYGNIGQNCEIENIRNKYWAGANLYSAGGGSNITIKMHQTGFCHGDSGGPVIDNNMTIVGVFREGPKEGSPISGETIEWITRITSYDYKWIQNAANNFTIPAEAFKK